MTENFIFTNSFILFVGSTIFIGYSNYILINHQVDRPIISFLKVNVYLLKGLMMLKERRGECIERGAQYFYQKKKQTDRQTEINTQRVTLLLKFPELGA